MRQALIKNMEELRQKSMSPQRARTMQSNYEDPPHRRDGPFHALHDQQENDFA